MPRPLGEPMRPGDTWCADCGLVYTPPAGLTLRAEDPLTLADWLDVHHGEWSPAQGPCPGYLVPGYCPGPAAAA